MYKLRPALCLDLDGTVRRTKSGKPFIESPDDIEMMPGIEKIIWRYKEFGYFIAGISNQGGVAHGFRKMEDVVKEINTTINLFKHNPFSTIKCCMHDGAGTVEPYNHRSLCRKPDIGMLVLIELEAMEDFDTIIDWDKSLFVGDRDEDRQCAENARIPFRHIDSFLHEPHEFTIG